MPGVSSFNTRTGAVVLLAADVTPLVLTSITIDAIVSEAGVALSATATAPAAAAASQAGVNASLVASAAVDGTGTHAAAAGGNVLLTTGAGVNAGATGQVLASVGTAAKPGYGFQGASNGGLGVCTRDGISLIGMASSGAQAFETEGNKVEFTSAMKLCWAPTGNAVGTATPSAGITQIAPKVVGATQGNNTTGGWFQSTGGEAALVANFTEAAGVLTATNLSRTLIAGRSYRIEGILQISNSTAAEGAQFDFAGGTATATTFFVAAQPVGNVTAGTQSATALNTPLNYTVVTGTDYVIIRGFIKVNAGGTVTLRAAENTSAAGTMTLGAGSWLAFYDTVPL